MTGEYAELTQKFAATPLAKFLGIELLELARGYARLSMVVKPEHLNFAKRLHGGVIMSLADQAFACSCNTYGNLYVAVQVSTNFFGTVEVGDSIIAESRVVHYGKSISVCEMVVTDPRGKTIAKATGTAAGIHNRKPTGELIEQ